MDYTGYTVPAPMRWDQVAYANHGTVETLNEIIESNPGIPADAILQTGTVVQIPIKDSATVEDVTLLPPWKR